MKIRTEFVYPPIPIRQFDWSAVDDDTYEPGCPIGTGATELEAVKDLMQQLEDDYAPRSELNEAFTEWFNARKVPARDVGNSARDARPNPVASGVQPETGRIAD